MFLSLLICCMVYSLHAWAIGKTKNILSIPFHGKSILSYTRVRNNFQSDQYFGAFFWENRILLFSNWVDFHLAFHFQEVLFQSLKRSLYVKNWRKQTTILNFKRPYLGIWLKYAPGTTWQGEIRNLLHHQKLPWCSNFCEPNFQEFRLKW